MSYKEFLEIYAEFSDNVKDNHKRYDTYFDWGNYSYIGPDREKIITNQLKMAEESLRLTYENMTYDVLKDPVAMRGLVSGITSLPTSLAPPDPTRALLLQGCSATQMHAAVLKPGNQAPPPNASELEQVMWDLIRHCDSWLMKINYLLQLDTDKYRNKWSVVYENNIFKYMTEIRWKAKCFIELKDNNVPNLGDGPNAIIPSRSIILSKENRKRYEEPKHSCC